MLICILSSTCIRWLKQAGLEHPILKHAKHIRRWVDSESGSCTVFPLFPIRMLTSCSASRTTLLLTPADCPAPVVPGDLSPYIIAVPRFPARTLDQVKLKAKLWPVFYEAQHHREVQEESRRWTRATVQWFRDAVAVLRKEAKRVRLLGEASSLISFRSCPANIGLQIPVVSYVPAPLDAPPEVRSYVAHDTRVSSQHPLRHSVFNLVRLVGDTITPSETPDSSENGQNYLLTSLTLFTTHEPCIACSMALLHSRVKEVRCAVIYC